MPLPIAAQIGIAAAPTALKFLNEKINPSQPTEYEKKLAEYAELFGKQAQKPITQNRAYRTGKRELDVSDKRNREQITNVVGAGNVTNEVKLASMDDANQSYAAALNRIVNNAQRFREYSQGQYMNALGSQENAKQRRLQQRQRNTASWMEPLSAGAGAFLQANALKGPGGIDPSNIPDPTPTGGPAASGSPFDIIDYAGQFG